MKTNIDKRSNRYFSHWVLHELRLRHDAKLAPPPPYCFQGDNYQARKWIGTQWAIESAYLKQGAILQTTAMGCKAYNTDGKHAMAKTCIIRDMCASIFTWCASSTLTGVRFKLSLVLSKTRHRKLLDGMNTFWHMSIPVGFVRSVPS